MSVSSCEKSEIMPDCDFSQDDTWTIVFLWNRRGPVKKKNELLNNK